MKGTYIDATTGTGGHSLYVMEHTDAKLLCFDADRVSLEIAKGRLAQYKSRIRFYNENFRHIHKVVNEKVDGIIFDLGISSYLVSQPEKGFSYRLDGPLDMRYQGLGKTAEDIIRLLPPDELARILYTYGGVKYAKRVANAIKKYLPQTTLELAQIIRRSTGKYEKKAVMKVFQALRIYVNDEWGVFQETLQSMIALIHKGGRIVVIAYHSGEEKVLMKFYRGCKEHLMLLTKKPIRPQEEEVQENKRSRSARLRAFEVV